MGGGEWWMGGLCEGRDEKLKFLFYHNSLFDEGILITLNLFGNTRKFSSSVESKHFGL